MNSDPTDPADKQQTAPSLFDDFIDAKSPSNRNETSEEQPQGSSTPSPTAPLSTSLPTPDSSAKLPTEARRALVNLMRMGCILASQKPKLFESLCRFEKPIQAHLDNMYLSLMLDAKSGVALILQQDADDDGDEQEVYSLITRRTLSLYDTLLLLVLRKYYQEREASGERRIVIDIEQIEAYLTPFLALSNSEKSDRRKLSGALTRLHERKIVSAVRNEEQRFEITPVIRYVISAEFLENLLSEYTTLAAQLSGEKTPAGKPHDEI